MTPGVLRCVAGVGLSLCLVAPVAVQPIVERAPAPALAPAPRQALRAVQPEREGFAPDRLTRLHARLQRFVDEGQVAGLSTLVARHGRVVDVATFGLRDREQRLPMTRDTIVRIYSMSKILTSVAALTLVEDGRLRLDEPIATWLPALASPQVFTGGTAEAPQLTKAVRPITVRHLLTHTSGFAYGLSRSPVDDLYREATLLQARDRTALIAGLARLPLIAQPGERFYYSVSTDVLGAIIEIISGQTLGAYLKTRVLDPLGLRDTGFSVPSAQRSRLAKAYALNKAGQLEVVTSQGTPYPDPDGGLFHSGGGGLFSTLDDYARFAQMLLNGGELDGARILGRKTVESMRANHLQHLAQPTINDRHQGFGLGVGVRLDLAGGAPSGSVGQFGWTGAASTYVSIDPQEQMVTLLFAQHLPNNQHDYFGAFSTLINAALVDAAGD